MFVCVCGWQMKVRAAAVASSRVTPVRAAMSLRQAPVAARFA